MAAPTIAGTASGAITIPCSSTVTGTGAWGTVGNPTFLAVINPGDVTAYIVLGGTGVSLTNSLGVLSPTPIPIPPGGQPIFLAVGANTNFAALTLRNGTQLTMIPST